MEIACWAKASALAMDSDGVFGYVDNCPNTSNPSQSDTDTDGLGDACDGDTGLRGGGLQCAPLAPPAALGWLILASLGLVRRRRSR